MRGLVEQAFANLSSAELTASGDELGGGVKSEKLITVEQRDYKLYIVLIAEAMIAPKSGPLKGEGPRTLTAAEATPSSPLQAR